MRKRLYSTVYPLVFAEDYYITIGGFVYYKKRELIIMPEIISGKIIITINGENYSLLNLMLEYFFTKEELKNKKIILNPAHKKRPLTIPLDKIKLIKDEIKEDLDYFNVSNRVVSANSRADEKITKTDVIKVLKKSNYSCEYCGKKIKKHNWHLDHVIPLSKGGKNRLENLCVACKDCNIMKHSMLKSDFLAKCEKITKFNK